ncbi:hypothetical protein BDY21DRAFT_371305 [Lineolata rhizophorae]|uniref:Uncharacterized protein n=1 Tax=Lineolata rhizophorae TaxID=578093 RepID=A0A6A6P1G0_9PEZI|nr:hypothetical protein BDY21DRAFT_371305 [Lineolata rhizophorae]
MPRDGSGASDNYVDPNQDSQVHGAGSDTNPELSHTKNVAPPPEPEKGAALEGLPASGGGSQGVGNTGQGGNKEPMVDIVTGEK